MINESIKNTIKYSFPQLYVIKNYGKLLAMKEDDYPIYLKKLYQDFTGNELNINQPERFTEKIQWRKLNDKNNAYSQLSDKYRVREWVDRKIGKQYLIPLLEIWENSKDIDFDSLPEKFVLKTNNGCATNVIVKDKLCINEREIRRKFNLWLCEPFWLKYGFELQYKSIKPMIIAEKYMEPNNGEKDLIDYKFYCFHGEPLFCQIIKNRSYQETIDFFDMNWNHMDLIGMNPKANNSQDTINHPGKFEEMKEIAKALANGFAFVRVDLYEIQGSVFFGEMTFTPGSGLGNFKPDYWDYKLGSLWDLNSIQVNEPIVCL